MHTQLFDLVEFWFDYKLRKFVKKQTHKYNMPRAICHAEKKKIIFLRPTTLYTRFKVVPNGQLQYSNNFKTIK